MLTKGEDGWRYEPGREANRIRAWKLSYARDVERSQTTRRVEVVASIPGNHGWEVRVSYTLGPSHFAMTEASFQPMPGGTPSGDIPVAVLRSARLPEVSEQTRSLVLGLSKRMTSARALRSGFERRPRPGRSGRSDYDYALVAEAYVAALEHPTPIKWLAERLGTSESQARDRVYAARQRGLLTHGTRGKAGGALTDKARKALDGAR